MARAPRRVHVARILRSAPRQVSFSKRRQGLFKKVCELSALCGTESAVLVQSPGDKLFSLGEPDVDTVVDRFLDFVDRRAQAQEVPQEVGEPGGAAVAAGGARRRQRGRGPLRQHGQRRLVVEELYRTLAMQDNWLEAADARLEELRAGIREMQAQLPHRWAAKVEDLEPAEAAEMVDALQVLSMRVSQVLAARQAQEGLLPGQASSSSYPPPPSSNPWQLLPDGSMAVGAAPTMPAMGVFQPPPFGPSPSTAHQLPWLDDDPTGGASMAGSSQVFGRIASSTVFRDLDGMMAGSSSGYQPLPPPPPPPPPPLFGNPFPSRRDGEGPSRGYGPPNFF